MNLPRNLIKDLGPLWLCLSTSTDSSVLQGQWVILNPLVSGEGSAKQWSLVRGLTRESLTLMGR